MRRQCLGFPDGHECPVLVSDRIYCTSCRTKRQEAEVRGIPTSGAVPVGIVLQDIEAPHLMCKCGGDAEGYDHEHSLGHMEWAYRQGALSDRRFEVAIPADWSPR